MCKFCDSKKEKEVMSYDNYRSMNVYCGQYQGVNVVAALSMKGNMLTLNGSGSYRSRSDCYYENEGLDCDNEHSEDSEGNYIKIEYCPFCGKKIESNEFEIKKTKDEIDAVKHKLKEIKEKLSSITIKVDFSFKTNDEASYDKAEKMLWKDFVIGAKIEPIKIETILKEFGNLKAHVSYNDLRDCQEFMSDKGIKFCGSSRGEFYGYVYSVTEEQYDTLVDMGLIKRNAIKVDGVRNKKAKVQKEVDKLNNKLISLQKKLKDYGK